MRIGLVEFLLILAIASLTVGPQAALFVDRWVRRANRANARAARRRAEYAAQMAAERDALLKRFRTASTVFGVCILLALGGIALLYESGDGATLDLTGTILVMVSALSYAIYIVGVNRPALKSVATLKVTFYVLLFGLSLFFVRLDFGSAVSVPDRWYLWGNLVALAVFPTAISFLCTTRAIQYIGSTPTAILGALEPVTAVFFGVAVFGESLTLRIGCGILLIIVAVSLIVAGNRIASYLVRFRKLFPRLPLNRKGCRNAGK